MGPIYRRQNFTKLELKTQLMPAYIIRIRRLKVYVANMKCTRIMVPIVCLVLFAACESTHNASTEDSSEIACELPQNPYSEGSGHYAGYEWAEQNNPATCDGKSDSFIEGCEEWQKQVSDHEACEAKKSERK